MKNIVLYQSKYGNSFQYASWIAENLGWELCDLSHFKKNQINDYNHIIFGSGVYMGKMNKIKKILRWFKNKPIIIFACAGNNNVQKEIDDIKKQNFTDQQLKQHHFFYLPGGVDFSKVTGISKMMLKAFKKFMEAKKNKTDDQIAILNSFTNPTNYVDKSHIEKISIYVKKHCSN
ncbi:MAG: flavodoxin domain-containing protein [Bacilli bacterium]